MEEIVLFVISFIIIYFIYSTFVIKRKKKYNPNKVPMEIKFLIQKYKLDMDKINYIELVDRVSLWISFDMALSISLVGFIKNVYFQILLGVSLLFVLVFLSYSYIGKIYKKRGLIKDV